MTGTSIFEHLRHTSRQLLRTRNLVGMDHKARGAERNRRAVLTSCVAMLARVVQLVTLLITIRITLRYLGTERFGLWMTVNSVLAMAAFADFGMGLGVLNTVANAHGKDDLVGIRNAISSGFAALTFMATLVLLLFFAVYRFVDWGAFFHVLSPLAKAESGPALAVVVTCFALNISLDLVQRVQLGLQQGYSSSLWQLCGTLAGFIAVVAGVWLHAGLPVLVAGIAGGPVLAVALNNAYFFGFVRQDLLPRAIFASRKVIRKIATLGGMFFISQMVVAITFSSDNLIIARTLGAATVSQFSVPQRMFSVVGVMATILIMPLWSAYGEAISRGDMIWVRHTLLRSLLGILLLTAFTSVALVLFSSRILLLWVGPSIRPSLLLLSGLAVWAAMQSVTGTLQAFLNGGSILRFTAAVHCLFGVVCLPAKIWLAARYGIVSLPWATVACYGLIVALPTSLYVVRLVGSMTAEAQMTAT